MARMWENDRIPKRAQARIQYESFAAIGLLTAGAAVTAQAQVPMHEILFPIDLALGTGSLVAFITDAAITHRRTR